MPGGPGTHIPGLAAFGAQSAVAAAIQDALIAAAGTAIAKRTQHLGGTGGTANARSLTPTTPLTLVDGLRISFNNNLTNTGSTSLTLDAGVSVIPIYVIGKTPSLIPLAAGQLFADSTSEVEYNAANNCWILVSGIWPSPNQIPTLLPGKMTYTSQDNNFNGYNAGAALTTGADNNVNGHDAGAYLTTGSSNNFNGREAGRLLTTGGNNNCNGYMAGRNLTTGGYNNCNGFEAGKSLTTGNQNNCNGQSAGTSLTTGSSNICNGTQSAFSLSTGNYNVIQGHQSGYSLSTGSNNNLSGFWSGFGVTTGSGNNIHGYRNSAASKGEVVSGNYNTSIGYDCAVPSPTADNQLCIANQIYGTGLDGRGATVGGGKIGIGTKTPSTALDVAGTTTTTGLIVATATPASASATGAAGTIAWDADYLYVCTGANTWKRTAIATW